MNIVKLWTSDNGRTNNEHSNLKRMILCLIALVVVLTLVTERASLGQQTIGGGSNGGHHHSKHHHSKHHHRKHHHNNSQQPPPSPPPPPTNNSPVAKDDSYSTDENQALTEKAPGVLQNDSDPNGLSLTAVKVSDPSNGTVTLNPDGSFTYTPNKDFYGSDTFTYKANDGTLDSNTATVTITVKQVPPVAKDDSYTATGNVEINVNNPNKGVLANDTLNGGSLDGFGKDDASADSTAPGSSGSSLKGGTVVLNSDGTFKYNPPAGYTGDDSFYYDLHNGGGDTHGKVTISISDMIWFVDDSKTSNGDGRLTSPYNTLSPFSQTTGNPSKAGQTIFVATGSSGYTSGVTLLNNQYLIGQGASQSITDIDGIKLAPFSDSLPSTGGTPPSLTTTASGQNGITLGSGDTVRGLNIGDTSGSGIKGSSFGTLATSSDVSIDDTTGQALNLNTGTLSGGGLGGVTSSGGTDNVSLSSVGTGGSAFSLGTSSDSLSGASSDAFYINGGKGSFSYGGTIDNKKALAANIQNMTGGTVTFSGAVSDSGTGVSLTSNTGATIDFTGGLTLNTGTNDAFTATGGGTVDVTGSGNTLTTSTGTALNVANTNIGGSGLTFKSISAGNSSNGPTNGIVLNSTGTSGGLTVTGDGANSQDGSGGTIQHTSGDAISLTSTANVSLSRMNVNNSSANGVNGQNVNGFVLDWSKLSNNGNTNAGDGEGGLLFGSSTGSANGLVGSAPNGSNPTSISNTNISSSGDHNIAIFNNGGTLTELDLSKTTLTGLGTSPPAGEGGSGLTIETRNSAAATMIATGSTFKDNYSVGAQGDAVDSSNLTFKVLGGTSDGANTFTNNNEGVLCSNGNGGANATCEVSNNTFTGQPGNAIFVGNGINLNSSATLDGKIQNNNVTQPFDTQNGSNTIESFLSGTGAVSKLLISGNTVTNNGQYDGISVGTPDDPSSPNFSVTVTNNNVTNAASAADNIDLQPGSSSTACFNVESNTTSGSTAVGINLLSSGSAVSSGHANTSLERGNSSSNDPNTVLAANNPSATANTGAGGTPTYASTDGSGTLTVVNNGTCATP